MKRFLISTAALALMSSATFAADMVEIVDVPVDVAHDWSGVYVGAHIGAVWQGTDVDTGCDAFKNITKEGGGAPTFKSASDIADVEGDGFYVGPTDNGDRGPGCFDAYPYYGSGNEVALFQEEGTYKAFALDGDYVAFDGFDGGDNNDVNFMGGVQLGINQQYGRLVVGLETDFSWFGGGDDDNGGKFQYFHSAEWGEDWVDLYNYEGTGTVSIESGIDWLATFRARAGGTFGNQGRLLIYGTAGVGVASVNNGISGSWDDDYEYSRDWCSRPGECQFSGGDDDGSNYQVGYALGLGAEYAFTDNLSFGLEYLYVGFGDQNNDSITFNADDGRSFSFHSNGVDDVQILRAKMNWKFKPQG